MKHQNYLHTLKKKKWVIADIKTSEVKRAPKPPFITSTLQQTASNRLGFSPSRTMLVAQKLYEAGHITYMRTDSPTLSAGAQKAVLSYVSTTYGTHYTESRSFAAKGKNAQEAHEAIRPSVITKKEAGSNEDQKRLYRLIWERTIASQMTDARTERTKVSATPVTHTDLIFTANGSCIVFDGWMKAHPDAGDTEQILPKLEIGEAMKRIHGEKQEKSTQPPPRYTEAGLVRELENVA